MSKVTWSFTRNIRGERSVNTALALISNPRAAAEVVGDCVLDTWGPLKGTAKHVARIANSNERSSENWMQRKVCPNVPSFLRIAMATPELNQAVMWLMQHGMESAEAQRRIKTIEKYIESRPEAGDQA